LKRAKIEQFPKEIREELDAAIIGKNFSGYREIAALFRSKGYEICKSAVADHGQKLERELAAIKLSTEQARAIVAESPDDDNAVNDALVRLVQQRMFTVLRDLDVDAIDFDSVKLTKMARGIADIARASINQKKFVQETREKIAARVKDTTRTVDGAEKAGGMSHETAEIIRAELGRFIE